MKVHRFKEITQRYASLRVAIVGDFCLDRYFDIDPARQEISIETGLAVHNIVRVRCQPGAAGTILNNLVALGVGRVFPIGICGDDGEGFELRRSLEERAGTDISFFVKSAERRTFTYTKPLVFEQGKAPVELNRLDIKNWTPTPEQLQDEVIAALRNVATKVDAIILLDQVDVAETGVITGKVLEAVRRVSEANPNLLIIADSRRGLKGYPKVCLKMNRAELAAMAGHEPREVSHIVRAATHLAAEHGKPVFITLAERGIVGAAPGKEAVHREALNLRGEIDIVGAGDSVTANLTATLAGGAEIDEAVEMAVSASSIVIHQLGTTGTASVPEIESLMEREGFLK
ncbi:MAG TPA: PfkB family carbohydrate kinase [Verrucomicrobiae bacterium]|nr:PfkB family carbohydrate kinase [Verrucomicrobiae bacterium]